MEMKGCVKMMDIIKPRVKNLKDQIKSMKIIKWEFGRIFSFPVHFYNIVF
jgi:hypothetical protein